MLHPVGYLWVHNAVPQPVYILTWCLTLYFSAYILNITAPPSTREEGNNLNQLLVFET